MDGVERSHAVARFARWSERVASSPYAPLITLVLIGLGLYLLPSLGFPAERVGDLSFLVGVLTLLLVFMLEHNERRDTAALHVKLDELLKATARERRIGVEELPVGEVEAIRERGRDGKSG